MGVETRRTSVELLAFNDIIFFGGEEESNFGSWVTVGPSKAESASSISARDY